MDLAHLDHWVFDLDGTLTVAVHDFDALRRALGLPAGRPILEAVAERPAPEAASLLARLDALEAELVGRTRAAPGAAALLEALARRGARVSVLTRNSRENALATLAHCGLGGRAAGRDVLGRDDARPKPDPDGVLRLLGRWGAAPGSAVVVGDYRFDVEAGRAAGAATVAVDPTGGQPWAALADRCVASLEDLVPTAG